MRTDSTDSPERPVILVNDGRPLSLSDFRRLSLSDKIVRRMLRRGSLRRVIAGVWVDNAVPDTVGLRAACVAKVVPLDAVVCDRSAAWMHGVDVLGRDGVAQMPRLDVFRAPMGPHLRRPECRGGTRTLTGSDVMSVAGVQVTSPLRTALDLGRLLRRHEAIGAIDALMRCCAITRRDLEGHLPRFRGARGVIQLRQLVAIGDPRAESPAESLVRLRLWDASLPVPELQWTVIHEPTGSMYRLDLAYPDIMLGIEYDGADDHTSSSDIEHDAVRRRRLEDMGWTIVVLRSADVYGPDATMTRTVRDAIALAVATR